MSQSAADKAIAENEAAWWAIGVSCAVLFVCCCALIVWQETCRSGRRKYETVEMMERRAVHIKRGDHENWDI